MYRYFINSQTIYQGGYGAQEVSYESLLEDFNDEREEADLARVLTPKIHWCINDRQGITIEHGTLKPGEKVALRGEMRFTVEFEESDLEPI